MRQRRTGVRLQDAVTIALIVLLVFSVGVSSLLWYRHSRQAATDGARRVQAEIVARIEERILEFLAVPHSINQANASVMRSLGMTNLDSSELEALFRSEIDIFETVSSIYAGSPEGGIVDAGREGADGALYVIETEGFTAGAFQKFSIDANGNRLALLQTVPDFDARTRPWYQGAVREGAPTWSDVYVLFSGQDMAVAASMPLYDNEGDLVLVLSSDIFLSQIDTFIQSLSYGTTGLGFIVDCDGQMIASSDQQPHITWNEEHETYERIAAADSSSSLVRETAEYVVQHFGGFGALGAAYSGEFQIDGNRQLLQFSQIRDDYGIDWLSVIVIPEMDFLGGVVKTTRTTAIFLLIALGVTLGIGIVLVRQVAHPLAELTAATASISTGKAVPMPHSRRLREIRQLSDSFESMSDELRATVADLQEEIAERKQAQKTSEESEQRLRTYIERAPVAVFVFDKLGQNVEVNPAACQMTGYSRDELLQMSIYQLSALHVPSAELTLFDKLKTTGSASGVVEIGTKDERELWLQFDAVTLDPHRFVAFCADVTRRRQTEESLRHQQKMESLGTMASGVAHEINNPLMGMMGYAELIDTRTSDDQAREYAADILREGERIAHIIRNLLAFTREDTGTRHPVDIRSILLETLPLVNTALLRSHVSVETDLDVPVPEAVCSHHQIQQVFANLIMNARDALDERYPRYDDDKILTIRVSPVEDEEGNWVRTTIRDRGTGMSEDLAARVFDPFFTTRSRDERTGLGLTISYGIVQEHAGRIIVESNEGEGTSVHVDLPAMSTEAGA
jgi:PAS domain S-box-containing protein